MSVGTVYPNEWAKLIAELCAPPMSKLRFAKEAGVGRNTPGRWISGETLDVSMPSIRLIAKFSGRPVDEIAQIARGAQERQQATEDALIRDIRNDPYVSDHVKDEAIKQVRNRRAESEESLRRDIAILLGTHRPQTEG